MNNFPSFLDTSSGVGPNVPRQAPSPSSASHQTNGIGGINIPMVNGMPSGGQQTDMNHLWGIVQQLSEVLAENRAQTAGIVNGVQQLQSRAAQDGVSPTIAQVNGELNTNRAAEITALRTELNATQAALQASSSQASSMRGLLLDYENAFTLVLDKLRPYAYNHTQAILALHKHYQHLLEQERATSLELRLEHAEWQAGLGRVADYARLALKAQNEGDLPAARKIQDLKAENRVLRRLAGWQDASDSEEEEAETRGVGTSPMPSQQN
ncbi:uncharacterized protein BDZ99DRAFT_405596 [Mytilinidion resinicola]|uniref:Uncharacterized protein n=1 Tax=Mytilinidion resinicola TaxID=574789 RepID=A0A6A6ZAG4_9PEZI|nr:uncharacterized protein BDZ99DRAFT_405596 [Mytilinidion resinicola]KAF2817723.1 hypothetical protein BDZ99DRAFT_405596 [Mytilinidion resinicola]